MFSPHLISCQGIFIYRYFLQFCNFVEFNFLSYFLCISYLFWILFWIVFGYFFGFLFSILLYISILYYLQRFFMPFPFLLNFVLNFPCILYIHDTYMYYPLSILICFGLLIFYFKFLLIVDLLDWLFVVFICFHLNFHLVIFYIFIFCDLLNLVAFNIYLDFYSWFLYIYVQ